MAMEDTIIGVVWVIHVSMISLMSVNVNLGWASDGPPISFFGSKVTLEQEFLWHGLFS